MKSIRSILSILLVSNSLVSSSLRHKSTGELLKFNFLNLIQPSTCKMSTNLREEVNRQKQFYESVTIDEKRKLYRCGTKFITLDDIPSWKSSYDPKQANGQNEDTNSESIKYIIPDPGLNDKISVFRGDLTELEIDCVVNAANNRLAGGGGVDGAIHAASGRQLLLNECSLTGNLPTGQALLTSGYKLPAKKIIQTVGPVGEKPHSLRQCYENSLNLAKENNLRTIAFPCVSTGVYGYPHEKACEVALSTVREWLEKNAESVDRIIFCLFLPIDVEIYHKLLPKYFP